MAVNLTWHSFTEQVWGIRLRCLTNCTCCETSERELFHIRADLHTNLCSHQSRMYINNGTPRTKTSVGYACDKSYDGRTQRQVCHLFMASHILTTVVLHWQKSLHWSSPTTSGNCLTCVFMFIGLRSSKCLSSTRTVDQLTRLCG